MFLFRKIGWSFTAVAVTALLLSVIAPAVPAFAQTPPVRPPLSLMTSPLPLNVVTKPGQTVTADLRVKNNGAQPEVLKVELLKFGAAGDTGRPQLMEREPADLYFNWISFSETNFTAEPNVWKTIKMTIKAPKEAAFGYYFAVLFSRAVPDRPTGNQSAVEGGVASLVLLNVDAPGSRREAKVAELVATQKVYEFLPAKFTVKLRNAGNVHVSPAGTMFIKRGDAQVAAVNFNDERGNILPGTDRIFEMNWADGFPAYVEKGTGSEVTRTLEWDFSKIQKLRFGKYTATLVAVYDDGQRDVPIEAVVSFWVIPWRILGVILLIVLLVGVGIWGLVRLLWKNIRRQATAPPADDGPDPNSLAAATKKRPAKAAPVKPAKGSKSAVAPPPATPEEKEPVVYEEQPVVVPKVRKPAKKTGKKALAKAAAASPAVEAEPAAPPAPKTPEAELIEKLQELQAQVAQLASSTAAAPAPPSKSAAKKTAPPKKAAKKPKKK